MTVRLKTALRIAASLYLRNQSVRELVSQQAISFSDRMWEFHGDLLGVVVHRTDMYSGILQLCHAASDLIGFDAAVGFLYLLISDPRPTQ